MASSHTGRSCISTKKSASVRDENDFRNDTGANRITTNGNQIIQLNVGGTIHTTRLSTLMRVPGSFFEAMFSGRVGVPMNSRADQTVLEVQGISLGCAETLPSSPASYFIDRDGKHFRHILNYLRCGTVVSLPRDENSREELATEADFYGLDDMLNVIRRPPLDLNEHLPKETLNIQEEERKLRFKFVGGSIETNRRAPYARLLSLFAAESGSNDDGFEGTPMECPLLFDANHPLRKDRSCIYLSTVGPHTSNRVRHHQTVTVERLKDFETNFDSNHPGILKRIKSILCSSNVIIAGGSVLRALTGCSLGRTGLSYWDQNSDIDLFIYGMSSKQEANELVRRIFLALAVHDEKWVIMRCQGVINIHDSTTKIQIILRLYDTPTEVLIGFDVDCCACCYTGTDVKITKRCHSALVSGINVLNPVHAWPQKPSYELRLGKYAVRGYAVYVPGLHKDRIGYCEEIQKTELEALKGIARFVKIDFEINSSYKLHYYTDSPTELHVRASTPREIKSLRDSVIDDLHPSEFLVNGLTDIYDHDGHLSTINDVLVPAVYGEIFELPPWPGQWFDHDFESSSVTRNKAIQAIIDCSSQDNVSDRIPKKLDDAWQLEKRSREYSNDAMEKIYVDTIYYSPIHDHYNGKTKNKNGSK